MKNPTTVHCSPFRLKALKEPSDGGKECRQCKDCMVSVSQNKLGVAIHLLWSDQELSKGEDVRCSIDIIPVFSIEEEDTYEVTRIVNQGMFAANGVGAMETYFTNLLKLCQSP